MVRLEYIPELTVNPSDLGLEVNANVVRLPERLRLVLEKMGVRNVDSLVAALQSFPTSIASQLNLDSRVIATGSAGALMKLRSVVDPRLFAPKADVQRRGMGALPPDWLRKIGS